MSNKGRVITGSFIFKSGRGGTQVCSTTLKAAITFVFTVIVCMYSVVLSIIGYNNYVRPSRNVVAVNAPESFHEFVEEYPPEDFRFFYDTWDAPYDFMQMSDLMHEHSAGIVIVFRNDFDEVIDGGSHSEILTYYRTDALDYKSIRDNLEDTYLSAYKLYLSGRYDIPVSVLHWDVVRDGIPTFQASGTISIFAYVMAKTFIPILLFIVLMYSAMSTGTEAISGQKERGTFSRLLLTPVARKDIITAFTNGVFIRSLIPAAIVLILTFLIKPYRHVTSIPAILMLTMSMALFISSLTVLISVMNDSVTSAQTAFLPIFFILISVAVTCINGGMDVEEFYYYIPVYGQFYGLGDAINGEPSYLPAIVCSILTLLLAIGITAISTKLLMTERFTALQSSPDEDCVRKEPSSVTRVLSGVAGIFDVIVTPLVVLSIFQLLAMIPAAVVYMRDPAYSDFIASLANVKTVGAIIDKAFEIIGIFMNDARFLALMSVSYIFIILILMWRAKGPSGIGLSIRNFRRNYLTGMAAGAVMMTLVFIVLVITGKASPLGFGLKGSSVLTFIFSLIMWVPQGAAEEVMFRGYMMTRMKKLFGEGRASSVIAITISSLLFSVFHSFNGGFSLTAFVNIFLLAVLFALIYEKTGSIVLTCGAHTMWNLFQGNIYGLSVSGNASAASLIATDYTGSAFGPEGTAEATLIIAAALILYVVITMSRRRPSPKAS